MAVVEKTIAASGADYTSIAAWEAAANRNSDTDIWKGVISDNGSYDESVVLSSGGTPSATSYLWLTVASGNRHAGVYDGAKAELAYTGAAAAAVFLLDDWCRIDWLQIRRTSGIGSNGCAVRFDTENNLLDYCIVAFHDDAHSESNTDGIKPLSTATGNRSISISNSVIYGWSRSGVYLDSNASGTPTTTVNLDHCTIVWNGHDNDAQAGNLGGFQNDTAVVNMYNCCFAAANTATDELAHSGSGTTTLNGSNNAYSDSGQIDSGFTDNTTGWVAASSGVDDVAKGSGSWALFTSWDNDATASAMDLRLLSDAGNVLEGAGTNRIGSEPDTRQDFATDITGGVRPASSPDIGAHHVSGGGSSIAPIASNHLRLMGSR